MPGIPLHETEDWTRNGAVITFVAGQPLNIRHRVYYSHSATHTHTSEDKSSFTDATWTLNQTPAGGEVLVFQENVPSIPFWIAYGAVGNPLKIRRGEIDQATGLLLGWTTVEITVPGITVGAQAYATAIKCHPTNQNLVYVATSDQPNQRARLFRWTGSGSSATQLDERTWTTANWMQIKDIFVESANPNSVWFVLSDHENNNGADGATLRGVYHAADGVTFALVGSGASGAYDDNSGGPIGIYVKTSAPRRIWTAKRRSGVIGLMSYSDNEGVTWTDIIAGGWSGTTGCWLQGYPYETDDELFCHTQTDVFDGTQQEMYTWRRVDSTLRRPIRESVGHNNMGGLLGTSKLVLLRPRVDFTDGGGSKADVTAAGTWDYSVGGANNPDHISQGAAWWETNPVNAAPEIRCFATSGTRNLFAALNDRQQAHFRITRNNGVTWSSIALPEVPHAINIPHLV